MCRGAHGRAKAVPPPPPPSRGSNSELGLCVTDQVDEQFPDGDLWRAYAVHGAADVTCPPIHVGGRLDPPRGVLRPRAGGLIHRAPAGGLIHRSWTTPGGGPLWVLRTSETPPKSCAKSTSLIRKDP